MTDTTMTGIDPAARPMGGDAVTFSWSGPTWGLAGLGFINALLNLVTLGIYNFWGKTEVRRRLTSSIRVNGEPMEYTGTGLELFLGFLIVLGIILLPYTLLVVGSQIILGPQNPLTSIIVLALYPALFYLYGVASYRARRYRRSRLRWRGVRGALTGNSFAYGWGALWTGFVDILVAGWLTPWRDNYLHRWLTNDTRFGDRPIQYTGKSGPLYPMYVLAWLGTLLILALVGLFGYLALWPTAQPLFATMADLPRDAQGQIDMTSPEFREIVPQLGMLAASFYGLIVLYSLIASVLWSLFYANEYRHFLKNTTLEGLRFDLKVSGWSMFWLFFSNTLLSLITLSILSPVAEARVARYFIRRLSAAGAIDFASIQQSTARLSKTGEGLAEAFDVEPNAYFILSL